MSFGNEIFEEKETYKDRSGGGGEKPDCLDSTKSFRHVVRRGRFASKSP